MAEGGRLCTSDPFVCWLTQWKPTDFSFTVRVFIAYVTFIWSLSARMVKAFIALCALLLFACLHLDDRGVLAGTVSAG
jgi:hypothetical protein